MCGLSKLNPFNITHGLVKTIANIPIIGQALPFIATAVGGPIAGAAVSGLENYSKTRNIGDALKSAGLSYAGNAIGNSLIPSTIGDQLGSTASNAIGGIEAGARDAIGAGFSQTASNALLNTSVGSVVGGAVANSFMPQGEPKAAASPMTDLTPPAFQPSRAPQLDLPGSLSGLSNLTPDQQASNIANQGVFGGGNGGQEQDYFNNLVNHQLVDDSGKTQDISALSPIENSYLSQLGLGGYTNSKDLLQAMSKWKNQAA